LQLRVNLLANHPRLSGRQLNPVKTAYRRFQRWASRIAFFDLESCICGGEVYIQIHGKWLVSAITSMVSFAIGCKYHLSICLSLFLPLALNSATQLMILGISSGDGRTACQNVGEGRTRPPVSATVAQSSVRPVPPFRFAEPFSHNYFYFFGSLFLVI
jgi:hypothetical protein